MIIQMDIPRGMLNEKQKLTINNTEKQRGDGTPKMGAQEET
jgi:hypothetical protein